MAQEKPTTRSKTLIDKTVKSIRNSFKLATSKEDRWINKYKDHGLEKVEDVSLYNIKCKPCNHKLLMCKGEGDLKRHLNGNKHKQNHQKWKDHQDKKKQTHLSQFRSLGQIREDLFVGFMFSSMICNFTGNAAVKFNNIFIQSVCKLQNTQRLPKDKSDFAKKALLCRNYLFKWMQQDINVYKERGYSYTIQLDAGNDNMNADCYAPLIQFCATQKPICMNVLFAETNANGQVCAHIINEERERYGLARDRFLIFLSYVLCILSRIFAHFNIYLLTPAAKKRIFAANKYNFADIYFFFIINR